jgi:3-oxoacyl-[acyl-carrier protein] reductase
MDLPSYDLPGRVALVTGAGAGIGKASAKLLASAGAVVVCADIQGDAAEATAERIRQSTNDSTRAYAAKLDVADRDAVRELIDDMVGSHGRIDILANIAGIMMNSYIQDVTEEELDRGWAVNFKGTFFACQAAARHMVRAGSGSIVNISSSAIDMPTARYATYATTKIAVAELTRIVAVEVADAGVRCNAIAPAFVNTDMTARHYRRADGTIDEERREQILRDTREKYPLHVLAEPEDIAALVHFLAADVSRVYTGQTFRPNGGIVMPP